MLLWIHLLDGNMNTRSLHSGLRLRAFTLVELMVALMVSSIILTATASLAFAFGSANSSTDEISESQAALRFASLRISELIKNSCQVQFSTADNFTIWADNNNNDMVDIMEWFYVWTDAWRDSIYMTTDEGEATLMAQCSNVNFAYDVDFPGDTRFISITFDMEENGIVNKYQICGALRNR